MSDDIDITTLHTPEFWDERYSGEHRTWSGRPNQRLVEQTAHLSPGDALELGCGEGGDAIWLAQQGWRVTATDVSAVGVEKARAHAAEVLAPDFTDRITWLAADARSWQPPAGAFDLVTSHYVHLPVPLLADLQERLAASVRPGGTLLIVNHDPLDLQTTLGRPNIPGILLTADEVAGVLDPRAWSVEVAEPFPRQATDKEGRPVTIHDSVVRAVRRPDSVVGGPS
jgi:SAM-dependent methyltransferase